MHYCKNVFVPFAATKNKKHFVPFLFLSYFLACSAQPQAYTALLLFCFSSSWSDIDCLSLCFQPSVVPQHVNTLGTVCECNGLHCLGMKGAQVYEGAVPAGAIIMRTKDKCSINSQKVCCSTSQPVGRFTYWTFTKGSTVWALYEASSQGWQF